MSVMIVTSLGDIVIDLYTERCPLTCKNFLKLCKIKYYNGCLFHTVQKDFTAQTGDPTGTGTGGDSIYKFLYGDQARFFSDEIHLDLKHYKTGTVAMASAGENLNASQFYITLRDDLDYLDGKHTVFGEVAEGLETLTRINEAYVDDKNRPYKNIRIKHTYILDDSFDDPPQLAELIPEASPEGKPKDEVDDEVRLEDDWVPMDEQLGIHELEEVLQSKEAHSRAVVLESIGDIPDAEIKPPDNVLFVCKLNPVTEDEDLHTIFSRFGTVTSAEVIRDYKTGDSLCYAFIEFETNEACEQAYFKMDNALIDDRRIHVDFSQSVAKLWSQYRRKDNQTGRGKGCFKCGGLDHKANDCTAGPATKHQPIKYILKDDNIQHGGDNNSRYDMVFDEDNTNSPGQGKRRVHHDVDDQSERCKMQRKVSEERERCYESKYRRYPEERLNREKHNEKRGEGDDFRRDGMVKNSREHAQDSRYSEERASREKLNERGERDDYRRDIREHARTGDRGHGEHSRGYRSRTFDDDNNHRERREDGDGRKRSGDGSYRKRGRDGDRGDFRVGRDERRHKDYDDYKRGREERDHRRWGSENDHERERHRYSSSNHGDRRK